MSTVRLTVGQALVRFLAVQHSEPDKTRASDRTTVVHIETDPTVPAPESARWWDVPVAEVSALVTIQAGRATYDKAKRSQRTYL